MNRLKFKIIFSLVPYIIYLFINALFNLELEKDFSSDNTLSLI